MTLNKLLLFCLLTIFVSSNGQEKANTSKDSHTSKTGPTVVRSLKAVGMAPDFDTTLVSQYIRSIFQDSKGDLWFGTFEGAVTFGTRSGKSTIRTSLIIFQFSISILLILPPLLVFPRFSKRSVEPEC